MNIRRCSRYQAKIHQAECFTECWQNHGQTNQPALTRLPRMVSVRAVPTTSSTASDRSTCAIHNF